MPDPIPNPVHAENDIVPPVKSLIAPGGKMEAWIKVQSKKIDLFKVDHKLEEQLSTSWCKGDWGKEYTVHVRIDRPAVFATHPFGGQVYDRLEVALYIDGKYQDSCLTDKFGNSRSSQIVDFDGVQVGISEQVPMMFAKPNVNSTAERLPAEIAKGLGSVQIRIRRVRKVGIALAPPSFENRGTNFRQINVKDKSAQESVTDFGPKYNTNTPVEYVEVEHHPDDKPDKKALYTFEFKYRPTKVLEAMGIIVVEQADAEEAEAKVEQDKAKEEDEDDHSDLDGPNSRKENSKDQDDGLSDDSWDDLKDEDSEDDDEMQVDDAPTANGLAGNGNDGTATGAGNVGVGGANDFEARAAQAMRDIAALQLLFNTTQATLTNLIAQGQGQGQGQANLAPSAPSSNTINAQQNQVQPPATNNRRRRRTEPEADDEEEPLDHIRASTDSAYFAGWKEREFGRMLKKQKTGKK